MHRLRACNGIGQLGVALADRVEEAHHPFLVKREVKTRGIILVTSDKGLAGPLNANLFKLVSEIKSPAKYYAIGRKGAQFLARTHRDMVADFSVSDRVVFAEVKVAVETVLAAVMVVMELLTQVVVVAGLNLHLPVVITLPETAAPVLLS